MSFERSKSVAGEYGFHTSGMPQSLNVVGTYLVNTGSFNITNTSDDLKRLIIWAWAVFHFDNLTTTDIGTLELQVRINGGAWATVAIDSIDRVAAPTLVKEYNKILPDHFYGLTGVAPGATVNVETRQRIIITTGGSGSVLFGFSGACAWMT